MKIENEEDLVLIREGLMMRICHIETGTPNLNAKDVQHGHGKYTNPLTGKEIVLKSVKIKALDVYQMKLIIRMEELIQKTYE